MIAINLRVLQITQYYHLHHLHKLWVWTCVWSGSPPGSDSQERCPWPSAAAASLTEKRSDSGNWTVSVSLKGSGTNTHVCYRHIQLVVCSASGSSSCPLQSWAPVEWSVARCSDWPRYSAQCSHGRICCTDKSMQNNENQGIVAWEMKSFSEKIFDMTRLERCQSNGLSKISFFSWSGLTK